jgi:hypothetical protein
MVVYDGCGVVLAWGTYKIESIRNKSSHKQLKIVNMNCTSTERGRLPHTASHFPSTA